MGDTFHLGCTKCKEHVWAARSGFGGSVHLYRGLNLTLVETFLEAHQGHPLLFIGLSAFQDSHQMELGEDGTLYRAKYPHQLLASSPASKGIF